MTSNSQSASGNLSLAQIVSSISNSPVPPAVLAAVAKTPYGQRNPTWADDSYNSPQMITALVLIEQSPAGKAWGVEMAAIPRDITFPSDTRYSQGCTINALNDARAQVEWFFTRSNVGGNAPMATISWKDPQSLKVREWPGLALSCNAVSRMLYAAQQIQSRHDEQIKRDQRLASLENKIEELEGQIAVMSLELKQATLNLQTRARAPTVTCLMHLFVGHTSKFTCPMYNSPSTNGAEDTAFPRSHDPPTNYPSFDIAPHTDRLSDLSPDAQNWLLQQLDTRKVWVRATDPDSHDNHISWTNFSGAVEMGKSMAFSHGNHRFW